MELAVGTERQYAEALQKMLPQGDYWENIKADSDSDINVILEGMAHDILYFRERMAQALNEAYPATADETIENWELVRLGKTNPDLPIENRRALILSNAGFSAIHKIAESYGAEISVEFPFRCGCFGWHKFGQQRLGAQNTLSVVTVIVTGGENIESEDDFEETITAHLLANHIITFKYITGGKSFENIEELSNAVKIDLTPNHAYPSARFGRATFGQTRIAAPFMDDVALVKIQGWRSSWKREDIESAVLSIAGKFEKICFVYETDIFYGGCRSSAIGNTFSLLAELSEHTGVELTETHPYGTTYFGRNRFGISRFSKPQASDVVFIRIGGYGANYRRVDIETAAMLLFNSYNTVYFLYGKEAIYGEYVS